MSFDTGRDQAVHKACLDQYWKVFIIQRSPSLDVAPKDFSIIPKMPCARHLMAGSISTLRVLIKMGEML